MVFEVASIAAITVGLTQAIKATGYLDDRFAQLTSIIIATLLTVGYYAQQGTLGMEAVLFGIIYGLTANGVYDATLARFTGSQD